MHITKMHGLGNDFIILNEEINIIDIAEFAKKICARRTGVGADGIMIVCNSKKADVGMRIINADGSEAEMCGNGIRCFAKYVYEKGIVKKQELTVETLAGIMKPKLTIKDGEVTLIKVDMGKPSFIPKEIQINCNTPMDYKINIDGEDFNCSSVLMGVIHTVIFCDNVDKIDIENFGRKIETHSIFPKKTNVNFAEIIKKDTIKIRTWERGAGSTLACGTGATATGVIAYKKGLTGKKIKIQPSLGELIIENDAEGNVYMSGTSVFVFEGDLI